MTRTTLSAAPSLIKPPKNPVRLRNRWHDNHFVHLEHNALEAGPADPGWRSAYWSIRTVEDSPFVIICNARHADHCLQMREPGLVCARFEGPDGLPGRDSSQSSTTWEGAHWYVERVKGTTFVRFRNRWRPDCYIHCEGKSLEATPIDDAWQSAQWEFV